MRKKTKILPYVVLGIITIGVLSQSMKHKKITHYVLEKPYPQKHM